MREWEAALARFRARLADLSAKARRATAEALARRRVALGFVAGAVVAWLAQPDCRSVVVGAVVGTVGETLRVWAAGHLDKGREITSSGPYRFLAHPLYIGSAIIGAGLAIASRSLLVAAIVALYCILTMTAAVRAEERFLRGKFGPAYAAYRRSNNLSSRRFDLGRAIANREYRAATGFAAAVVILAWRAGCW